jgi:beta-lactamase class A
VPSPARSAVPIAAVAAPTGTPADTKLADQIKAILGKLPQQRTAVFQSLARPVRADLESSTEVSSASTIKLPLMISVYRAIAAGRLKPTKIHTVRAEDVVGGAGILQGHIGRTLSTTELLETTLTYSDNTGANMLLEAVGGLDVVNATMAELGFKQTHMRRLLMDVQAQERGLDNTTSAADLATMLMRIDQADLISREASNEMLRILELRGKQTDPSLDFLGRHLVPRPTIAHLNGTLVNVRNDAGIVELEKQRFVFVVLLRDQGNDAAAEEAIARAAADVTAAVQAP